MKKPRTPEQAYNELWAYQLLIKELAEDVEAHYDRAKYQYSPFQYIPSKLERNLREIKDSLIKYAVAKFKAQYMPNAEPWIDIKKALTEAYGELGYSEDFIEKLFQMMTKDKKGLRKLSYAQLLKGAQTFVPWFEEEGKYGRARATKENQIRTGNMILLHAYTWRTSSYSEGSVDIYKRENYEALEKVINVILVNANPIIAIAGGWLSKHIVYDVWQNPEAFYGKHYIKGHRFIEAFQFFKNDKFKIWFKNAVLAELVARALTGDNHKKIKLMEFSK